MEKLESRVLKFMQLFKRHEKCYALKKNYKIIFRNQNKVMDN